METILTNDRITAAYSDLENTTRAYRLAEMKRATAHRALETAISASIVQGTITGKNKDEREAVSKVVYANEFEALETLQEIADVTRLDMDLAAIRVAHIHTTLQLLKVNVDQLFIQMGEEADHD